MSEKLTFRECLLKIKPYIPGKPIDEVKREFGLDEVIKIASNENPLGPSPMAVEAINKSLNDCSIYPDGASFELKTKLAAKLNLKKENIIFGNGGDEVIFYFAQSFLNENNNIVVPNCTFSEYETSARVMGAHVRLSKVNENWQINLDNMLELVDENTKAVYITNPNNPTGALISSNDIENFMNKLPADCITFIDEAYYEYVEDPDYTKAIDWIKEDRNIIILRTFSKIYGLAGLRIGYGLAPVKIINIMELVKLPFNTGTISQIAALAALDDINHITNSRKLNSEGKIFLYNEFKKLGLNYTASNANFVWVDLKTDCKKIFIELLKKGVIVRTGDIFGAPTHIRVTFGTRPQLEKFITELKNILGK